MISRSRLGTCIPTVDLPAIRSTKMLSAFIARHKSSVRPVIRLYFTPASGLNSNVEAGVKYSRITGLTDDLCLAMKAESILVERMAGKSTVGIQVPNREREIIWLRANIEAQEFMGSKSR